MFDSIVENFAYRHAKILSFLMALAKANSTLLSRTITEDIHEYFPSVLTRLGRSDPAVKMNNRIQLVWISISY